MVWQAPRLRARSATRAARNAGGRHKFFTAFKVVSVNVESHTSEAQLQGGVASLLCAPVLST